MVNDDGGEKIRQVVTRDITVNFQESDSIYFRCNEQPDSEIRVNK